MNITHLAQFLLYEVLGNVAFNAPVVGISAYIGYKIANGLLKNILDGRHKHAVAVALTVAFVGVLKMMGVEDDGVSNAGSLATIIFYIPFLLLLGNVWKREQKYTKSKTDNKVEIKERQTLRWFWQLLALLKNNSKAVIMVLATAVILAVAYSTYIYNKDTDVHRLSCTQNIHYKPSIDGGAYLIFWNDTYVKKEVYGRDSIRKFGTQREAMEYCLTFLEVETRKPSTQVKKQGLTLDEIFNEK